MYFSQEVQLVSRTRTSLLLVLWTAVPAKGVGLIYLAFANNTQYLLSVYGSDGEGRDPWSGDGVGGPILEEFGSILGDIHGTLLPVTFRKPDALGEFEDETNCWTGNAPLRLDDQLVLKEFYYNKHNLSEHEKDLFLFYDIPVNPELHENCQRKHCYFDAGVWTPRCGFPSFGDGETCLLGLPKPPQDRPQNWTLYDFKTQLRTQLKYGKNCGSGKCHMDGKRKAAICGAHSASIKPNIVLLASMVGFYLILKLLYDV